MSNWESFVFAADVHGDMQSKSACAVFFQFCKDFKPKRKIFGGDLWDFRCLRKGASEEEKRESMAKDFRMGMDFIEQMQPDILLRGNHDERLWETAETGKGVVGDYALSGITEIITTTEKMGCRMLPYHKRDGIYRLGSLKMLHGFHCGIYAARQTALIYGNALFGHVHVVDQHCVPGLERRVGRAIGCLATLDFDYSSRNPTTLRQANGFAYGFYSRNSGKFIVNQAERIDGKWMLPMTFKEYQ